MVLHVMRINAIKINEKENYFFATQSYLLLAYQSWVEQTATINRVYDVKALGTQDTTFLDKVCPRK